MPKFITISPTSIPGKKKEAWARFRDGGYVAIGWLNETDLTGKSFEQISELLRDDHYSDEEDAIVSFQRFLSLERGDYVAVTNTNDGIFGVGVIESGYKFKLRKHDTGDEDGELFYPHYRDVRWIHTQYSRRTAIVPKGEPSWKPYGTIANYLTELPPYITRILGGTPQTAPSSTEPNATTTITSAPDTPAPQAVPPADAVVTVPDHAGKPELPCDAYLGSEPFVFVSYAHKDAAVVYPEIARLHRLGYRIWYDEGISPGSEWPEEVAGALERAAFFLVYVTPQAVASKNVRNEINFAIADQKPFLAVHFERTQLTGGLKLQMGNLQAILKYELDEDRFRRRMEMALPAKARQ